MTVPKPCSGDHNLYFPFRPRKENLEIEEVKPHPSLSHLYSANKMLELQFSPVEVPMLCPPLPWLSTRTGAYILRSTGLVRVRAPTSFYPHPSQGCSQMRGGIPAGLCSFGKAVESSPPASPPLAEQRRHPRRPLLLGSSPRATTGTRQ